MKVSVSLSTEDVEFLDAYAQTRGYGSRSAVLQQAVSLLRSLQLGAAYESAWAEWAGGDASLWEVTTADGNTTDGGARNDQGR
jgi:Arc/MetJ-type ribon-helix-helix transcriptional regulator